jgi:hypothetical protein
MGCGLMSFWYRGAVVVGAAEELKIALLQSAVVQLTGALVEVRSALNFVVFAPNLGLAPHEREAIQRELQGSVDRVENVLKLLDKFVEVDATSG